LVIRLVPLVLTLIFNFRRGHDYIFFLIPTRPSIGGKEESWTNDFNIIPTQPTPCFRTSPVVGLLETRKTIAIKLHRTAQSKRLSSYEHSRSLPYCLPRYYFEIFRQNPTGSIENCRTSQTLTVPTRYVISVVSKIWAPANYEWELMRIYYIYIL